MRTSLGNLISLTITAMISLLVVSISAQTPVPVVAFPGAEGYGAASVGGRGGKIIEVTNLNDAGTGSFRAACQASGKRIVVFRVAGIIEMASDIIITNPYITIAGQTAPGDGICIKYLATGKANRGITIQTHDVVIRYLRIRCGFSSVAMDYGSPFSMAYGNASNVILDHCSSSWHPGRTCVTIWPLPGYTIKNVTVQRHLAAEALLAGNYPNGARGAFLLGSGTSASNDGVIDHITLYENLMAHHKKRHPEAKTRQADASLYIATFQFINNVAYHFNVDGMMLCGNEKDTVNYHFSDEEVCHYNVIGNYFKRSELDKNSQSEIALTPGARVYAGDRIYGNIGPARPGSDSDPWDIISFSNNGPGVNLLHAPATPYQALSPFDSLNLPPIVTAEKAYTSVLNDVGANRALNADGTFRNVSDAVDRRIINEVLTNTGSYCNFPTDKGGWPTYSEGTGPYTDTDKDGMADIWETANGFELNDPADGPLDADSDGFTNVEEFLNGTNPKKLNK